MAIRFVDLRPGERDQAKSEGAAMPRLHRELESGDVAVSEPVEKLPLAKPEPKPRGRKKPLR